MHNKNTRTPGTDTDMSNIKQSSCGIITKVIRNTNGNAIIRARRTNHRAGDPQVRLTANHTPGSDFEKHKAAASELANILEWNAYNWSNWDWVSAVSIGRDGDSYVFGAGQVSK